MTKKFLHHALLENSPYGLVVGPSGSGKSTLLWESAKEDSNEILFYNPLANYRENGYFLLQPDSFTNTAKKYPYLFHTLSAIFSNAFPLYKGFVIEKGIRIISHSGEHVPMECLGDSVIVYLRILSLFLKPHKHHYTLFIDNANVYMDYTAFHFLCTSLVLISKELPITAFLAVSDNRCICTNDVNCFVPMQNPLYPHPFFNLAHQTPVIQLPNTMAKAYTQWLQEVRVGTSPFWVSG